MLVVVCTAVVVLVLCCRLLDVPEPKRPTCKPVTRLQVEAELTLAGLDW